MGITLLESLKNIAWDSYLFEGMTDLAVQEEEGLAYHPTHIRASYGGKYTPYKVFGGACYEWLNYHHTKRPLSDFIDPTGDVDLLLYMPELIYDESEYEASAYYYKEGVPIAVLQHLLDWITAQLTAIFEQEDIRSHMGNLIVSEADTSEGVTLPRGKKSLYDDKLWIVQSLGLTMTKVQVCCQFEGMTHPEHIVEFVMPKGTKFSSGFFANTVTHERSTFQVIDGLRMETIGELYKGNQNSLMNRTRDAPRAYLHKHYNHIQRLKYLNMFCSAQFPVDLIPEYLFLMLFLKGDRDWLSLSTIPEESENKVKVHLYGNLLLKLIRHLHSVRESGSVKSTMSNDIFHASRQGDELAEFIEASGIEKAQELVARFDMPKYVPYRRGPTPNIRKCHGQDCAVMGGKKTNRKKLNRLRTRNRHIKWR